MRACIVCMCMLSIACSSKDNPGPDCPKQQTTVQFSWMGSGSASATPSIDANSVQGIVNIYCQGCHKSDAKNRRGAPLEVVFDTYDDTVRWGLASDEQMANYQMPPYPAVLSQDIICRFDNWVQANYPP